MEREGRGERTRRALLEAVVGLLERRNAGDISVREIAAAAGVNHGLVHHYFGSKQALIREAVRHHGERITLGHPSGVSMGWTLDFILERPELARIAARLCLDGPRDLLPLALPPKEVIAERNAIIQNALTALGLEQHADARVLHALATAVILGWVVFRPLLDAGFELPEDADESLRRLVAQIDGALAGGQR